MSDHTDPPAVAGLRDRDITDLYAFHPPGWGRPRRQRRSKMVLVLAVNPLSPAGTRQFFSDDAEYKILIDTDGDADEDIEIEFEFEEREGRSQEFEFEIEGDDWEIEGEGRTDRVLQADRDVKVFAGLRDDPFFFDLGVLSETPTGKDTFAGTNVSAIVLELPTNLLTPEGPNIGVWGAIEGSGQIDRVGRPAISTVLIPSGRKDAFNEAEPEDDVEDFTADVVKTLTEGFGRSATDAAAIAGILLPDILTVDTSKLTAFLNGRNLDDDVIDTALQVVTGDPAATDGIDANDVRFRRRFPYLAPPH